jgi:YD repeat-containing protein
MLVCGLAIPLAAKQSSIRYVYDDFGRLIGVVDASGNSAVYHYDAVGNVMAIDRYTATQIVVIALSPGIGAVGSTGRIQGSGFSTTISQNSVSFNGVAGGRTWISRRVAGPNPSTQPSAFSRASTVTCSRFSPGASTHAGSQRATDVAPRQPGNRSYRPCKTPVRRPRRFDRRR